MSVGHADGPRRMKNENFGEANKTSEAKKTPVVAWPHGNNGMLDPRSRGPQKQEQGAQRKGGRAPLGDICSKS